MENMSNSERQGKSKRKSQHDKGCCSKWLKSPSFFIYINYFLSQWGDWMWQFAVGLYLVHLDGNQLRLAAIFGFTGGTCILLFGGVIGDWVDRNQRLKVVRISLFIQNLSVALSSVGVCLALIFDPITLATTDRCLENQEGPVGASLALAIVLRIAVLGLAIVAQLASVAYRIAIEKDWLVEIAEGNARRLANLNATTRSLDLACKVVAPLTCGLIMTYGSQLISAVCLAVWNLVSVFIEYSLVAHVYSMLPRLHTKNVNKDKQQNSEKPDGEMKLMARNHNEIVAQKNLNEKFQSSENLENSEEAVGFLDKSESIEKNESAEAAQSGEKTEKEKENFVDEKLKKRKEGKGVVRFLLIMGRAWKTYARQVTLFAGLSLALLYMTVLGFDSITLAYIKANDIEEWKVGLSMGLAGVTGIIGTFFFTRLHRAVGLNITGLVAFTAEILCLTLCIASVWLPGSRFDLSYTPKTSANNTVDCPAEFHGTTVSEVASLDGYLVSTLSGVDVNSTDVESAGVTDIGSMEEGMNDLNISILCLLLGIISSRIGLWMADLVVTQLMQEAIAETERGVVNGVQNSLNMLMDMLKFALVILLPHIETFGLHIIISFSFIALAGLFFVGHVIHCRKLAKKGIVVAGTKAPSSGEAQQASC